MGPPLLSKNMNIFGVLNFSWGLEHFKIYLYKISAKSVEGLSREPTGKNPCWGGVGVEGWGEGLGMGSVNH